MKLDVLVFAAHPDDAELACSGTILSLIDEGKKVGVIDLTRGELGSRGTPEERLVEANESKEILGLHARENLDLGDGFFDIEEKEILALVKMIRKYQPDVILANSVEDRHPDHGRGGALAKRAHFLSGLLKIETEIDGVNQKHWRAKSLYHYIQDTYLKPDFVIDITPYFEGKLKSIEAFKSQFKAEEGVQTYISSPEFWSFIEARAQEMGHSAGFKYGEGYVKAQQLGFDKFSKLL